MLKVLSCFFSLTELRLLSVLAIYTRKPNNSAKAQTKLRRTPNKLRDKTNREDGRRSHELGEGSKVDSVETERRNGEENEREKGFPNYV